MKTFKRYAHGLKEPLIGDINSSFSKLESSTKDKYKRKYYWWLGYIDCMNFIFEFNKKDLNDIMNTLNKLSTIKKKILFSKYTKEVFKGI